MSFAFSQVDPETSGQATVPVPLDRYLSSSFEQGFHDSALDSLMRMDEIHQANMDNTKTLDPGEANGLYAIGDLKFDQPVKQSVAQILNQRKRDEMDRNFFLSEGASKARFIPGMAASLVGGMSNPLDLGLAFVPVAGEEKLAASVANAGGDTLRYSLARGMVQTSAPRLVNSTINGTAFMVADQIPHLIAARQDMEDFTARDALINTLGTAAFGIGLHASFRASGLLLDSLQAGTREKMAQDAVEQFLRDESPDVSKYVNVDENAIRDRVAFNEDQVREQASQKVDMGAVRAAVKEKYGEDVEDAAILTHDGEILTGPSHMSILHKMQEENIPVEVVKYEGFVTSKGRFVSRIDAANLLGQSAGYYNHYELESHKLFRMGRIEAVNPEHLSVEEHTYFQALVEGGATRLEAMKMVRDIHMQKHDAAFFSDPEVQRRVDEERQSQVEQLVSQAKQDSERKFTQMRQAEIERQQREGRILSPEQIQEYTNPENFNDVTDDNLDRDIANLEENLSLENKGGPSENLSPKQQAIEKSNKDRMKKEFAAELEKMGLKAKPEVNSIKAAADCIAEKLI